MNQFLNLYMMTTLRFLIENMKANLKPTFILNLLYMYILVLKIYE